MSSRSSKRRISNVEIPPELTQSSTINSSIPLEGQARSMGELISKYSRAYNSKNTNQLFNEVADIFDLLNYPEGVEIIEKYHQFKDSKKHDVDRDTTLLLITYGLITYLRKTRQIEYHEMADELETSILQHEASRA